MQVNAVVKNRGEPSAPVPLSPFPAAGNRDANAGFFGPPACLRLSLASSLLPSLTPPASPRAAPFSRSSAGHDKGSWYAMKTLSKAVIIERNHVNMVMKERNLLARLQCPQLVNMHYAFQDARNLYIVMDVCLGGDLHYQLTHAPSKCFQEHQARFYCASIITCLEYMHSVGVIHRDIKPENLLLDARGQVKVTDLGISMELVDGYCTSTSGTRPYMAPEIFMSGHKHTAVAEFYSLGITVYQFLLGQRPYRPDTNNMKAIVRMATFVPPEKYTDLAQIRRILMAAQERRATSAEFHYSKKLARFSPEARDFVMQCLICNPRYRLGSQGISELMSHPWFAGIDWDAMRRQEVPAPFLPDTRTANCAISTEDLQQLLLSEEEAELGPEIKADDQLKFSGYDYRTRVRDHFSGRGERIVSRVHQHGGSQSSAASMGTVSVAPTEANGVASTFSHLRGHNSGNSVHLASMPGTSSGSRETFGRAPGQPFIAPQGSPHSLGSPATSSAASMSSLRPVPAQSMANMTSPQQPAQSHLAPAPPAGPPPPGAMQAGAIGPRALQQQHQQLSARGAAALATPPPALLSHRQSAQSVRDEYELPAHLMDMNGTVIAGTPGPASVFGESVLGGSTRSMASPLSLPMRSPDGEPTRLFISPQGPHASAGAPSAGRNRGGSAGHETLDGASQAGTGSRRSSATTQGRPVGTPEPSRVGHELSAAPEGAASPPALLPGTLPPSSPTAAADVVPNPAKRLSLSETGASSAAS
jgi:serine/threonine protein kinase